MAANGVNAVRTYTVPPRWLLDLASEHRLYVMVGLPWEEHVTFLDDRRRAAAIEERMREMVRSCAGHPAILCYAIGNEIPASIVRWHGKRQIERFLKRLYIAAKSEDPGALVTYVNYPSTEYLSLPVHRPRVLQRVPRVGPAVRVLPRSAPAHRRRPPARGHGGRPRLAAQLRGGAGAGARLAGPDCVLGRLCRDVRVLLDGRVVPRRLRDRRLGVRPGRPQPRPRSRRWPRSARPTPRCRSHRTPTGRGFPWSSARTTARARCAAASTACATCEYPDYEVIVVNDGSTDRRTRSPASTTSG